MQKQGGALEMPANKILVTGGAGFIGSNLVDVLAPTNEVTVVDNLSTGSMENIQHHVDNVAIHFVEADIRDIFYLLICLIAVCNSEKLLEVIIPN